MATSTYLSFLMKGTGESTQTWDKLIDIKDYPDLGGEPEMLETTTLSDRMQTHVAGIQSLDAMSFTCNYEKDKYTELVALANKETDYAVWFGGTENADGTVTPTGAEGKYKFKGMLSVYISGKGVNEVREMVITIAPSTVITPDNTAA